MKAWTHLATLTLLAAVLAGCTRDDQSGNEPAQPVAEAVTTKQLKKPVAKDVNLTFTYHLRRDRVEEVKPDVFQRRILMEYLKLDQQQAADAISANMISAGYQTAESSRLDDGRIRLVFQKGKQKIRVLVREGGKLQNPEAKGLIRIDVPAKAPKAKTDAAQDQDADAPAAGEPATN